MYDAANFDLGFGEVHHGPPDLFGLFENGTVRRTSVAIFLCPSAGGGEGPIDLGPGSGSSPASRRPVHRLGGLDRLLPVADPRAPASSTRTAGSASPTSATGRARP